jgi:hypothetical protein
MRPWRVTTGRRATTRHSGGRRLCVESLEARLVLSGVVTIGDSWAWLVAAGAPGGGPAAPNGFSNSLGTVMATFQPGVPVYDESFGGGTAAQMVAQIYTAGGIIDRINAHPDADVVWLSSGGNDMLLGQLGGGFVVNSANNPAVYAAIQANVQTIVNAILADRPDLQIVIMGYDYLNIWDQVSGSNGDTIRANLGVVKSGNTLVDAVQNQAVNDGFKAAEVGKQAIADASRRVAEVQNFGLNNTYGGYSGYFGNFAAGSTYPPELYPYLPTPPNRMDPGDAIHLNNLGYTTLALHAEQNFLLSAFTPASLGLSSSSLPFGQVRIGTSSSLGVTASNTGPNYSKVQNLSFPAASGAFGGGGQSFNPLFQDPTLGSDTATVNYSFAPTAHSSSNQPLGVTSDSGSPTLTLSGRGVGPVFSSASNLSFGTVPFGTSPTQALQVGNTTPDGNLGSLTDLKLLSATITGPDASRFSLSGFVPGTAIAASGTLPVNVQFDGTAGSAATYNATLTLVTDQGAAGGSAGQTFDIPLSAALAGGSTVTNAFVFYKGSPRYDTTGGSRSPLPFSDDNAIATDKSAYIPDGSTAGFGNYTSYSKGLNGIMVDLLGSGAHTSITLANILDDFTFKVGGGGSGSNMTPGSWVDAPNPTAVSVRTNVDPTSNGLGTVSGSDRVELIWDDNAIPQQWLEVIVKATADTGLAANDVFFYGNEIGNTNSNNTTAVARTGTSDISVVQTHGNVLSANIPISNLYDFDRDGKVGTSDISLIQTHGTNVTSGLKLLVIGSGGPFAPDPLPAGGGDAGVASALASMSTVASATPSVIPLWIADRLSHLDLNHGPVAKYFEHLAHENTAKAKEIVVAADRVADALGLDDEWLDSLVAGLP